MRRHCVALAATFLVSTGWAVSTTAPAQADDDSGASVIDLVMPVIDLDLATADLKGAARVDSQKDRVKVTLSSEVLFDKDSAKLRPVAGGRLKEIAQELGKRGPGSLSIVGYTDDLGSEAHGLALSRKRAESVAKALRPLVDRTVPFTTSGKGEADPAVPNDSEANRKLNRRVELLFKAG